MSSNNTNAVQRFTYDWLIRFVELHPIKTHYSLISEPKSERYGPEHSPFGKISPLFSALLTKYMPIILQPYTTGFKNGELRLKRIKYSMEVPPADRKAVIIAQAYNFLDCKAGTLTKYKNRRVFCADLDNTQGLSSSFTPAELFYLAKYARKWFSFVDCTVTERVDFSDLWPLLKRFNIIEIEIKNLVMNERMIHALLHRPWDVCISSFMIHNCSLDENLIMSFIECFLKSPKFPGYFEWILKPPFRNVSLQSISGKVKDAMKTAGYVWDVKDGKGMDHNAHEDPNMKSLLVRTTGKVFHVLMIPSR